MERIAEELDAAHKELEHEANDLLTLKEKVKIKLLQAHREGDLKRLAEDMQEVHRKVRAGEFLHATSNTLTTIKNARKQRRCSAAPSTVQHAVLPTKTR